MTFSLFVGCQATKHWRVASVMRAKNLVRFQCARPASKHYCPEQSARPLQQTTNTGDRSGVGDGQEKR